MYTQCLLQNEKDLTFETSWIPDEFARKGKRLIIGKKDTGYPAVVKVVYGRTDLDMALKQNDWTKQRKCSDI